MESDRDLRNLVEGTKLVGYTPATHVFEELESGRIRITDTGRVNEETSPWLVSESGSTSVPLLRRRLKEYTTRQVPHRANPLGARVVLGGGSELEGGVGSEERKPPPLTTDVNALVRADPGFSCGRRHEVEVLVECPLDRRKMALAHFEHCSLCGSRVATLAELEDATVQEFATRVFGCFDPGCYAQHLFRGLCFGYLPAISGPIDEFSFDNYRSVLVPEHPEALRKAWAKQRDMDGVFGAGDERYVSPLTEAKRFPDEWRAKQEGSVPKRRVCFDASRGINPNLLEWRFRYTDFPFILAHVRKGDFIALVDLRSFYLQLPMAQEFTKYLSLRDPLTGELLRYLRCPFGLSTAPAWASAVTAEVRRVLLARGVEVVFVYVDDYIIIADSEAKCAEALAVVLGVLREFNIAVSGEKIVQPTQAADVLGITIDTKHGKLRIKEGHVQYSAAAISNVLRQGRLSKKLLKSLCGMFTWISPMVKGSRPYVRSMWDLQKGKRRHRGRVKLTAAARLDLKWWREALCSLHDVRFEVSFADMAHRRTVLLSSDAAGELGWGVWYGEQLYSGMWNETQLQWSMPHKELAPPVVAIEKLARHWKGALVVIATDSITNAYAINAGSSSSAEGIALLKRLAQVEREYGIDVVAVWLPREFNIVPDALSKGLIHGMPLFL